MLVTGYIEEGESHPSDGTSMSVHLNILSLELYYVKLSSGIRHSPATIQYIAES